MTFKIVLRQVYCQSHAKEVHVTAQSKSGEVYAQAGNKERQVCELLALPVGQAQVKVLPVLVHVASK